MTFAALLKRFLDNSKETQTDVADAVGVGQGLVSQWLASDKGKVVTPHSEHWPALASYMDLRWNQVGAAVYASHGVMIDQGRGTSPADLLGLGYDSHTPQRQIRTRNRRDKRLARQLDAMFDRAKALEDQAKALADEAKVIADTLRADADASKRHLTKPRSV